MRWGHGAEVALVEGGDFVRLQPLRHRDYRRIRHAQRETYVLTHQLGHTNQVSGVSTISIALSELGAHDVACPGAKISTRTLESLQDPEPVASRCYIAWRALGRLVHGQDQVTPGGHWNAAAILADGLGTMFRRTETTLLLDRLCSEETYWRSVLQYSAWGNLQAVLDEYLHHLALAEGVMAFDDDRLATLATTAANAIALRPSRYEAFDPLAPDQPIAFTSRFALRYGGRHQNEETSRQPETRRAFNSPFWPFVLASTSVGQEGIDFHWWSHALVHWNTPPNPVDFEQREGRIDHYAGHAVRRNIAHRHDGEILRSGDHDPWRAAYEIAVDEADTYGEFAPH